MSEVSSPTLSSCNPNGSKPKGPAPASVSNEGPGPFHAGATPRPARAPSRRAPLPICSSNLFINSFPVHTPPSLFSLPSIPLYIVVVVVIKKVYRNRGRWLKKEKGVCLRREEAQEKLLLLIEGRTPVGGGGDGMHGQPEDPRRVGS